MTVPVNLGWNDNAADADQHGLKGNLKILHASRRLIAVATVVVTLIALLYAQLATPMYEANLLIHVEEDSPNASTNILSEVSSLFETKKAAIAEMELLRSRMVVAHAVDQLQLAIEVRPHHFPVIGSWLAHRFGKTLSEPGLFGLGGYVWGSEKAVVSKFDVPDAWQNRDFVVTTLGQGRYRLSGGEQDAEFEGLVGGSLKATVPGGLLDLRIERIDALPGAKFQLRRLSRLAVIEAIQTAMTIGEHGKQSGIIEVKLVGDNAQRINRVLGEIGRAYLRQNLARKSEEAEKSLAFLNLQLPALKRQLEQSEERYNQFRNSHGSIDMVAEARLSLQQAAAARTRRIELQQKRTALLTRFTASHPVVRGLDRQLVKVQEELQAIQSRIKTLPVQQLDETRLLREIKLNTDLYTKLANTAQRLGLIAVGRVSNVRLIDAPMTPERPVKPNRPVIVALGVIIGMFIGVMLSFVRRALSGAVDDARTIERMLGARVVYATIPHSKLQDQLAKQKGEGGRQALLAQVEPSDPAVESLRTFRTALLYSLPHFRNNMVMINGPTRRVGKSFVSANLAAVLAASGKRVLLVDADLRSAGLHRYFGLAHQPGLTNAIAGAQDLASFIHRGVLANLDFIPSGTLGRNRTEILLHRRLAASLESVRGAYDVVLIDAAPILTTADALTIGAIAGAVFILARAGHTTEQHIHDAVRRMGQAGLSPHGVLFNDLVSHMASEGPTPAPRSLEFSPIGKVQETGS